LLTRDALSRAINTVRSRGGFVQPFNGLLVEFDQDLVDQSDDVFSLMVDPPNFAPDYDQHLPDLDFRIATPLYGGSDYLATGGAVVCDRKDFFMVGGYNENFISYGYEDMEFFARIEKLGYGISRIDYANAYHLPHPRGTNSSYNNYHRANKQELTRVQNMSAAELRHYAHNGFRTIQFSNERVLQLEQGEHYYHMDLLPDERVDLSGLELVFLVLETSAGHSDIRLERVFRYLETEFTHYRVVLFERGNLTLRHPLTMKNYIYHWLDPKQVSEQQARDLVMARSQQTLFCLEIVDRNYDPEQLLARLQEAADRRPAAVSNARGIRNA